MKASSRSSLRGLSSTSPAPSKIDVSTPAERANARLGTNTSNLNILPNLSAHMRQLMRLVPHPVVVITAATPSPLPSDATSHHEAPLESTFRGMTVSSFNSVALSPTPLVSFNIRLPSATYAAMTESGTFLAHLLVGSTAGAHIANALTKGNNGQGEAFRDLAVGERTREAVQIFAGRGTQGAPLIAGEGVLQALRCRPLPGKEISVEDHRVLVAEVLGIVSAPSARGRDEEQRGNVLEGSLGLVYGDRRYRAVGPSMSLDADVRRSEEDSGANMQRTIGLNVRRGDEQ